MVIYHLVDDAISSPLPVDYRTFIVPFIGRGLRLIEIRCRDSSWRNLLLENVSSARISRLLIFNKAESSAVERRVGFQRPPFMADSSRNDRRGGKGVSGGVERVRGGVIRKRWW